jgi:hypothetical protein
LGFGQSSPAAAELAQAPLSREKLSGNSAEFSVCAWASGSPRLRLRNLPKPPSLERSFLGTRRNLLCVLGLPAVLACGCGTCPSPPPSRETFWELRGIFCVCFVGGVGWSGGACDGFRTASTCCLQKTPSRRQVYSKHPTTALHQIVLN